MLIGQNRRPFLVQPVPTTVPSLTLMAKVSVRIHLGTVGTLGMDIKPNPS